MSAPALFPAADTPEAFGRIRRDETVLRPGVDAVCARLGLDPGEAHRYPDGSLPVYAVGPGSVLKLYPPCYREERDREAAALGVADGRLEVPTPSVEATGELEGWGYLRMSRLRGTPLSEAWETIPPGDRLLLAEALGRSLAQLHRVSDPRMQELDPGWPEFLAGQRATARQRQEGHGLEAHWLERIDPFLDSVPLDDAEAAAFLHTEVMRQHLLAAPGPDGWRLTGLFDFESAMTGAVGYEFASVGLFFSCGDRAVFGAVLAGYGSRPDPAFSRRCLAYTLLHRYGMLPWYLERMPPPPGTVLEDLADLWWGAP